MNSIDFHSYKNAFRLGFLFFIVWKILPHLLLSLCVFFSRHIGTKVYGLHVWPVPWYDFVFKFVQNEYGMWQKLPSNNTFSINIVYCMYVCVFFFSSFCCCPLLSISFDINGVCLSFYFSLLFANNGIENWRKTG